MTDRLPASDRALLLAFRAWRVPREQFPWDCLNPDWSRVLQSAWDREYHAVDPEQAWALLHRLHVSGAVVVLDQVHPSWIVRALQDEAPSVQAVVLSGFPEPRRAQFCQALAVDPRSLATVGPSHPETVIWAQSFWPERLVGGPPLDQNDPTVIAAITVLTPRELALLIRTTGLAKLALAEVGALEGSSRRSRTRTALREELASLGEGIPDSWIRAAREDRDAHPRRGKPSPRNLGLLTFARLLAEVDPSRARWALQHLPYPVAKRFRASTKPTSSPMELEERLLGLAWNVLAGEGRLVGPPGGFA